MTIRPQDFFGSSPKTVLNKPFFHAQDQKAYNVDGGSSVADAWTKRTLNTVIHNDIQGASLANDEVSLPAGTYYVEGKFTYMITGITTKFLAGIHAGAALQLQSSSGHRATELSTTAVGGEVCVSGVITLEAPSQISLRYYTGQAAAGALGVNNNADSITDASIPSIYADLKIWQLDRSLEIAPKTVNSGLQTVPGLNTEGHIMGFDVTTSGNTLTITKGSCLDSTLTVPIAFTADKTVTLPGTVNQDFFVFAVRLLDGVTFEPRAYTTLAGPASDAQINAWQLISYAKNNGSGVTMPYLQVSDRIDWITSAMPVIASSITTGYVSYSIANVIPITLCRNIYLSGAANGGRIIASYDGVIGHDEMSSYASAMRTRCIILPVSSIYLKYISANGEVGVGGLILRR